MISAHVPVPTEVGVTADVARIVIGFQKVPGATRAPTSSVVDI